MATSIMRDTALTLAGEGFPVIQLYSIGPDGQCNCSPWHKKHGKCKPGKHPALRKGGYNKATTDPQQINRWFKYPRNVGIATGPAHLIAFDPDTRNGGDRVLSALASELGPLPPSRAFQSGSGDVRTIYRLPAGVMLKTGKVTRPSIDLTRDSDALDIIADTGGLIVAGTHKTGHPYRDLGGPLADLPQTWAEALQSELCSSPFSSLHHNLLPIGSKVRGNGEEQKSAQGQDRPEAQPAQLHTGEWLWGMLRPGVPWPEPWEPVRCLFCDDGQEPDSGFVVSEAGHLLFHCFHQHRSYTLQDVYARLVLKKNPPTDDKALAKMRDEMYLESRAIERPEVQCDPVPADVSDNVRLVYMDVINRLEHNWVSFPGQPVMYTATFGALRLGLHSDHYFIEALS